MDTESNGKVAKMEKHAREDDIGRLAKDKREWQHLKEVFLQPLQIDDKG